MNLYLLRVRADLTEAGGGFHSPIVDDRSYLFIPIPDWGTDPIAAVAYESYQWNSKSVKGYLPDTKTSVPSIKRTIHNDPECITFTYGSPRYVKVNRGNRTEKNYNGLKALDKGDILTRRPGFRCILPIPWRTA